jgi:hypothetical protein
MALAALLFPMPLDCAPGEVVTLHGRGLRQEAIAVTVGNTPCIFVTPVSAWSLECKLPAAPRTQSSDLVSVASSRAACL